MSRSFIALGSVIIFHAFLLERRGGVTVSRTVWITRPCIQANFFNTYFVSDVEEFVLKSGISQHRAFNVD